MLREAEPHYKAAVSLSFLLQREMMKRAVKILNTEKKAIIKDIII